MKVVSLLLVLLLAVSSAAFCQTSIESNGFFIEGVGYITTQTIRERNPWGVMVTTILGFNDRGELLFKSDGSGDGWVKGFMEQGFAGLAQGGGVMGGMALLRPSNTNVSNDNSGAGSNVSATGGAGVANATATQAQGQAQGQLQGQLQTNKNTFTPVNINKNKGGWVPPGQQKKACVK